MKNLSAHLSEFNDDKACFLLFFGWDDGGGCGGATALRPLCLCLKLSSLVLSISHDKERRIYFLV